MNGDEIRFEEKEEKESDKIGSWILVIVFTISLSIVGYLWWNQKQSREYTGFLLKELSDEYIGSVEEITLGVETILPLAAVWVAENKSYFEEQGINLTIKEFDSKNSSFLYMLNGDADISSVAYSSIVFNSFDRQDFSIFATFAYSYENTRALDDKETFNFVMMNYFAKNNPEILKRFLKAIDKANLFIEDDKNEAQVIVSERLNLDRKTMEMLWEDFVFDISLDQSLIITLEDEARWAIKNNLTDKTDVPNYLDYIYIDALEEIKPESVGIIH